MPFSEFRYLCGHFCSCIKYEACPESKDTSRVGR